MHSQLQNCQKNETSPLITLIVLAQSTEESLHLRTTRQTGTMNKSLLGLAYTVKDSMS